MKRRLQRLKLARRLRAVGVPLEIDGEEERAGLLIRQIGPNLENCAFDLRDGRAGYIDNISIAIRNGGSAIARIALELPWADCGLSLIDDPLNSSARYNHYWFPGNATLAFDREAVINHFVNVHRLHRRGTPIEGLLLFVGSQPIPDPFVHGVSIPASVVVGDQFENFYKSEIALWVDRSERAARDKHTRRSRLFSERDPSPVYSRSEADPITNSSGNSAVGVSNPID